MFAERITSTIMYIRRIATYKINLSNSILVFFTLLKYSNLKLYIIQLENIRITVMSECCNNIVFWHIET